MADAENQDGVAILVGVKTEAKRAVRVNITLPEDVLKAIDAFAEAQGLTRSGFLVRAAIHEIGHANDDYDDNYAETRLL
jgi:metal-responsive CopG/Arc/MetJ family transcriptional regulator